MQTESFFSRQIHLPALASLSLREAAQIVHTANRFHCDVEVVAGGRRANAKSILGMSLLPLKKGGDILVEARGEDGPACLESLALLVEEGIDFSSLEF